MKNRLDGLFLKFQKMGFMLFEIPWLIKDVFITLDNCRYCNITTVNQELEDLGWGIEIMDNVTYELAIELTQNCKRC